MGEIVAVRADPTRQGPVIAVLPSVDGHSRYRVFHSSSLSQEYAEDQLVGLEETPHDPWSGRLTAGPWLDAQSFRARLIASRLANPQTDHVYALRSARIQFIPFQFKPLLRLLRSDQPRLLIADDVGVGKTIEAGLILKELTTRQNLERVLVLCPKALTVKWRTEMRRFDEAFRVLDAKSLRYCLDETSLEGVWPTEYSRAIVHYELARLEPYLTGIDGRRRRHQGFLELDPQPEFDLVIADEAHHLRTPGTGSHRLMEFLCGAADAVLLLSATPVQVSSENLFVLLSLLRPDLFPDMASFREVTEPNRFITNAIRALRAGPLGESDWLEQVRENLKAAAATRWGMRALRRDPDFARVEARTLRADLDDAERVSCVRDLEEVHSLAHVMNRTRRRDIGRFTIRQPHTVSVPFTPAQRAFYENVLLFRRRVLLERHPPQVVNLILDTLERQAASSITALAQGIESLLSANGFRLSGLTDDPEFDRDVPGGYDEEQFAFDLEADAESLMEEARALPADDPKFDRLLALAHDALNDEAGPGKMLVFSFFLHTLEYLNRRLSASGVRVQLITGRTPDEEREELRDRFRLDRRDPRALDVLLSSEVGCEGLDYEFCDRLVNYDIPWNPMRIEQRIGRIDRFGQSSDKVLIFNFVTPGTVEERVFYRCFERLGIFTDTVGDLEEVLGPMVQELNHIALERSLTPEQAEQQARQLADNALRLAEEQRRLDTESGSLLGLDDAFTAEIGAVVDHARFVDEADIELLVRSQLGSLATGATLSSAGNGQRVLNLTPAARDALAASLRRLPKDRRTTAFTHAIESADEIHLTFDQAVAVANRSLEFVTPVHPLARLAVQQWTAMPDHLVCGMRVATAAAEPGRYIFVCERWETIAARPEVRLECLAVRLDNGTINDQLADELLALLRDSETIELGSVVESEDLVGDRLHRLVAASESRRRARVSALAEANDVLVDRRVASLQGFYGNRLRRVRQEVAQATESRITRMKESEQSRIEAEFSERVNELERARTVEVLSHRVAAGYLEVVAGVG